MKESNIIICDKDAVYAKALVQAFQRKKAFEVNYIILTDPNKLLSYEKENSVLLYILAEDAYEKGLFAYIKSLEEEKKNEFKKRIFLLTESTECEKEDIKYIFKYQPVNAIIEPIGSWIRENYSELAFGSSQAKIIGIAQYAGNDTGCLLGHLIAKIYSESQSVLYVNMELFPFLFGGGKTEYTLSDYIYAASTGSDCTVQVIAGMQYMNGNLKCVTPVQCFEDLYELKEGDINRFLRQLKEECNADIIILVFDFLRSFSLELLSSCDKIVTCEQRNLVTERKREQMLQMLALEQKEWVMDKMTYCNVETNYLLSNINEEGEISDQAKAMFYQYLVELLN